MLFRHISVTWSPVVRDTYKIPFDLESTLLQIKTNSTAGSAKLIWLETYNQLGNIGNIGVYFNPPIKYYIGYCINMTDLPVQPPNEVDKIWTIRKTATALSIECNEVEVLNYQFSDSSDTDCVTKWGVDVMKIKFTEHDTASEGYEEKPTKGT